MWTLVWTTLGGAATGPECSLVPPEGFVLAIGVADGIDSAALTRAREDARARLIAQVCAGLSAARCAGVARHVRDWKTGAPEAGRVCATAAVRRDAVDAVAEAQRQWTTRVDAWAATVAERVSGTPVALGTPVWSDHSCTTGAVGAAVEAQLRSSLAGATRLVEDAPLGLDVKLGLAGETVAVSVTLSGEEMGPLDVAVDALGLARVPEDPCTTAGARPIAATGMVTVDGVQREETHWLGACRGDELDAALMAVQSLSSPDERARLSTMVTTYRAESVGLCGAYERFEIDSATYARRTEELARWARLTQTALLAGAAVGEPSAVEPLSLEVKAMRSTGAVLSSGDVVRAGDTFELRVKPSDDSYVYVVYENSAGESAIIPESGKATFVPAESWAELPRPGFEFVVDDQVGRSEVVHVLATPEPVTLDALEPSALAGFKARGLGVQPKVVVPGRGEGQVFYGDPASVVEGYGGVLYTLVLNHR